MLIYVDISNFFACNFKYEANGVQEAAGSNPVTRTRNKFQNRKVLELFFL